jgi:hypothetical protein
MVLGVFVGQREINDQLSAQCKKAQKIGLDREK